MRGSTDTIEHPDVHGEAPAGVVLRAAGLAQVILDSIGDAVVSTNIAGNITYLNPVAERMTGWSGSEASGRPLQDVVRIIDAYSREPVRDPLAMAMRQDDTVGLGEDCLLVRRDAVAKRGPCLAARQA